jgi:hypothetical protein
MRHRNVFQKKQQRGVVFVDLTVDAFGVGQVGLQDDGQNVPLIVAEQIPQRIAGGAHGFLQRVQ